MVAGEELEGPCRRDSAMNVFTANYNQHSECMYHCEKLGKGRSPPIRTLEELKTLQTELQAITPNTMDLPWLWLSATDQKEEGVWRDFYTGERLGEFAKPWYSNDDQLGDQYNCLNMYTDVSANISWGETTCFNNRACPCKYNKQPVLLLRGTCQYSYFDYKHTPKQLAGSPEDVFLIGQLGTQIRYNESSKQWVMTDARASVMAKSQASKESYALGKQEWTVTNDVFACNKGEPYTTQFKLSGCNLEGEFTCNDGQCVTMEERCDQIPDCRDKSDERDCKLLETEEGYNRKVPPITSLGKTDKTIVPVKVNISISLLKIVGMEEVQHKIDLQFEITLEWKENRATYQNLKKKTSLNALTDEDISALWLPYVIYANTDMKEAVQIANGLKTTIVVTREGNFTRSDMNYIDEFESFKGKDNKLVMSQTYTKSFQCPYNLQKYPFDIQVNNAKQF